VMRTCSRLSVSRLPPAWLGSKTLENSIDNYVKI
jgi:hypothetical protein